MNEEKIGIVSNYYKNIGVAAVILEGTLAVGDTIHIKGHKTDFTQKLESMQIEHKNIEKAKEGDDVGIKVNQDIRKHDIVYKLMEQV
ncbi:MAG: translation elongation factor-like protein [Nitrospirae bacterium]|nr:translation elongation factor-like protein [Nitrospirota bacterium]